MLTPPPTSYTLKTVFDENPVIRNNKITTAFKAQSPRRAFGLSFAPGDRNLGMHETLPSSAEYVYDNKSVGADSLFTKFKERGSKSTRKMLISYLESWFEMTTKKGPGPGTYKH